MSGGASCWIVAAAAAGGGGAPRAALAVAAVAAVAAGAAGTLAFAFVSALGGRPVGIVDFFRDFSMMR